MKLVIHSVGTGLVHNIRTWEPEDLGSFSIVIRIDIGQKSKKGSDTFTIRVATPSGLELSEDKDNIIAERPLLIMRRYDIDDLISWINKVVLNCEGDTWRESVENLRRYFNWEYDDYREY